MLAVIMNLSVLGFVITSMLAMVLSPQGEEAGLADAKHFLHFNPCDQTFGVRLERKGDLLIRETCVNVAHGSLLMDAEGTEHRCSLFA
jgi:hypothetical protein